MYGRRKEIISKNRFREALLFVVSSLPYLEIFVISGYERNWETIGKVIILYFIAYFIMGLFNRPYLETIKKIVCLPEKIVKKTIRRKKRNAL
jgi:hypothetical protein